MPYSDYLFNGLVNECSVLKLSLTRSGSNVLIYAQNMAKHIIHIKRIILCWQYSWGGATFLYLREPQFIIGDQIEPHLTWLMYSISLSSTTVTNIMAQAEYAEFTGRAVSSPL